MRILLDIESRSVLNLKLVGSYRYTEDSSTIPLCIGWEIDGTDDPRLWWYGDPIPEEWLQPDTVFVVHNAQFDRVFFNRHIFQTRLNQWDDTMIRCLYHGLPASLEGAGSFLFNAHKDPAGEALIHATNGDGVCQLQTQRLQPNGKRKRAEPYWNNDPNDLHRLGEYCKQDVRLLRWIDQTVPPLPPEERESWLSIERMNDNGVPVDYDFVTAAIAIVEQENERAIERLTAVSNGEITSPGQTQRIQKLAKELGIKMTDCQADTVERMLEGGGLPTQLRQLLEIRQLSNSAQVKKYAKTQDRLCADGRVHGEIIAYGAHTGRPSSRGVQLQNGKRGKESEYLPYRAAAVRRDPAYLTGWVDWNHYLSSAVRSIVKAPAGHTLIVRDYSGIEARVADYLAGDSEGLDMARAGIDRYVILASRIYGKAEKDISKTERACGKESRLSGQYGVGPKTYRTRLLKKWKIDISFQEAKHNIEVSRKEHAKIVESWDTIMRAWRSACAGVPGFACHCRFEVVNGWMVITAPNGRSLYYYDPVGGSNPSFAKPGRTKTENKLVIDPETGQPKKEKRKTSLRVHIYGGFMLENLSQWFAGMIARDDIVSIQKRFDAEGLTAQLLFPVHDEIVILARIEDTKKVIKILKEEMEKPAPWCQEIPLNVDGWEGKFYRKGD